MKLLNQLKNRHNILAICIAILILVLFFRLATLTIARGEELRKASDEKRVRELSISAPRGEIRDRYGRLLAGNQPSFAVQAMKDELNNKNIDRNTILLNLINILEDEGENYIDELPVKLNTFHYKEEYKYLENNQAPVDMIIETLISQDLIGELLDSKYLYNEQDHSYRFLVGQRAKNILKKSDIDVPINVELNSIGEVEYSFDTRRKFDKWLVENNIESNATAKYALTKLITEDEHIVRKMLSNSVVRKLTFEILTMKGLATEIDMAEYSLVYDEEYWDIKDSLIETYKDITVETTAIEDFVTIAVTEVGEEILESVITQENGEEIASIVPAKLLYDKLNENNITMPIEVFINEENGELLIDFTSEESMKAFLKAEKVEKQIVDEILSIEDHKAASIKLLLYLGEKYSILNEIITDDDIKGYVQGLILEKKINPKISVSSWEYVANKNKEDWLKKYSIPAESSTEDVFNYLREKYTIDAKLSIYETRGILVMIEHLNKQGYKAYEPITVAYGIENRTVARIEENNMDLQGIRVSVEPVRYYPEGYLAAHTLGYMGKISQPSEIQRYLIERDDYSPNDIIGKTGIEQRYEEYLSGEDGTKRVEVDAFGNTIKVLEESKATPGDNVYLTIDAELQRVAEESLKHALEEIQVGGEFKSEWGNYKYTEKEDLSYATSGAVVAIDVKTGEVLAIVSYPAYDPNLFSTGISTSDWESLKPENEKDLLAPRPLYNIAIQTPVQPGSTYKMITALAALEKGLDPEFRIRDKGYINLGATQPACWLWNASRSTHGYENLYDAIRDSCNYYFFSLMIGTNERYNTNSPVKLELNDLVKLSKDFGLDEKTGIEINGEISGTVPSEENQGKLANDALRTFLTINRGDIKEAGELTDDEIELIISHAYGWANDNQNYTKGKINNKLTELGLDLQIHTQLKFTDTRTLSLSDYITFTYLSEAKFQIGNWLNISIGQGENAYTPIQMTSYIATLANDGVKANVSVLDGIKGYDDVQENLKSEIVLEDLGFNQDNIEAVQEGMRRVTAQGGTSYSPFRNFPVTIAGKTGTAERDGVIPGTDGREYDNFAWFTAYAPYDDPQIAVTTLLFQGGHGGYGAPIAREIIAQYLGLNSENDNISFDSKLVR